MFWNRIKVYRFLLIGIFIALIGAGCALEKRDQIFHLRGDYNYQFYKNHPQDYALTTVAHWAHGRISDILLEAPPDTQKADAAFFEKGKWFLEHPSKVEPHQDYVAPEYARLVWRAIRVVDWTHQLHEQLYDIMTDPNILPDQKKQWVDRSVEYYLSEPESGVQSGSLRGGGHGSRAVDGPALVQSVPYELAENQRIVLGVSLVAPRDL